MTSRIANKTNFCDREAIFPLGCMENGLCLFTDKKTAL
jgi:hypothetical protein